MNIDAIGNCVIDINDVVDYLMSGGNISDISRHSFDFDITTYNNLVSNKDRDEWRLRSMPVFTTKEEMDSCCGAKWLVPETYRDLDIENYIYSLCETEQEVYRVQQELEEFKSRDLLTVLTALKYLVDTMKSNNILWGVGRGSSVASYCLYLLEVHSVNSIKYNLDFTEFLD